MSHHRARVPFRFAILAVLLLLLAVSVAHARVGGGDSYSGSSSRGGSSSGGSSDWGLILWLVLRLIELHVYYPAVAIVIDIVLVAAFLFFRYYNRDPQRSSYSSRQVVESTAFEADGGDETAADRFTEWRKFDPNFSELLFEDFLYALFGHVHTARGQNKLDDFAPYLSEAARGVVRAMSPKGLTAVEGVIVGAFSIVRAGPAEPMLRTTVRFEANYTERTATGDTSWYAVEEWDLTRKRDVQSKPPGPPRAANCPKCGAGLSLKPDGTCTYCSVRVVGGQFDWGVATVRLVNREPRGPLLTTDVPDVGLDRATVAQPNLASVRQRFLTTNTGFDFGRFETRVRFIFAELQEAWSSLKWEKARPFETDSVFQMHGYWIEAYRRQKLRNVLKDVQIRDVVVAKLGQDAFYDAITCRIFAGLIDYVEDASGKVVRGNPRTPTRFSEYWTFVRRRGVKESGQPAGNCPNCGAELKINMAGTCEYCGSKITSGDFDWVLSRIEQDESYEG